MLKTKYARKVLVMPDKFLDGFVTDFYDYLAILFISLIPGLRVIKTSEFVPSDRLDVVVVFSLAHWENDMAKIEGVPSNATLICWYDDFFWINERARELNIALFDRAQCIIHASKDAYLDMWGKYEDKSFWLPFFVPPYFHRKYNHKPHNKCLLTGSCSERYYPFRKFIEDTGHPFVTTCPHPGYSPPDKCWIREQYAKLLYSYFCCVTDGGLTYGSCKFKITGEPRIFRKAIDYYLMNMMGDRKFAKFKTKSQVVLKFFEIPAAGSLLIANNMTPEMKELGYRSGVNYLSVDKDNVVDVITDCCKNPDKYEQIRRAGWLLSQKLTMHNRREQLRDILSNVEM